MTTKLGQTEDIVHLWNQCNLDMSNGTITIPPSAFNETIHSVGISFMIAMLSLLVKPKDSLKTELEILEKRKSIQTKQKEEENDLRLCCGLDLLENSLFLDSRKEIETETETETENETEKEKEKEKEKGVEKEKEKQAKKEKEKEKQAEKETGTKSKIKEKSKTKRVGHDKRTESDGAGRRSRGVLKWLKTFFDPRQTRH